MGNELKELGNKSTIVFMGNIIGNFIMAVTVIIIGRVLGPEVYGKYVFITSFLVFFSILPKLGMDNGIISFLSRSTLSNEAKKSILSYSLLTTLILNLLVLLISYINKDFIFHKLINGDVYGELFLWLLPTVLLTSINALLTSSLKAIRRVKEITIIENILNPIIKLILFFILVFVFHMKSYYSLIILLYVNSLTSLIYYIVRLNKYNLIGKINREFENKQLIRFSVPLLFTGIVSILLLNADRYLIGYFQDARQVGIYKLAIQFGTLSSVALASVNTIFAPLISNLYHNDRMDDMEKIYKFTTKWITIINLMIFGMILVFSKDIMSIPGKGFIDGSSALIIISIGQIVNSLVGSVGYINIMTGRPKADLSSNIVAMVLNLLLNVLLIPRFGIDGSAIATAIALFTKNIMNFTLMYRNLKMNPYDKSYLKLILVLSISVITILFVSKIIPANYWVRLIVGGSIYSGIFIVLLFLFVLTKNEVDMFKQEIFKKMKK